MYQRPGTPQANGLTLPWKAHTVDTHHKQGQLPCLLPCLALSMVWEIRQLVATHCQERTHLSPANTACALWPQVCEAFARGGGRGLCRLTRPLQPLPAWQRHARQCSPPARGCGALAGAMHASVVSVATVCLATSAPLMQAGVCGLESSTHASLGSEPAMGSTAFCRDWRRPKLNTLPTSVRMLIWHRR
jgi:hypothetical protein